MHLKGEHSIFSSSLLGYTVAIGILSDAYMCMAPVRDQTNPEDNGGPSPNVWPLNGTPS
jgi:hypothetical protein